MKNPSVFLVFIIAVGLSSCSSSKSFDFGNLTEQSDYLVYLLEDYPQRELVFYDPVSNSHIHVLPDWDITEFSLSKGYRLAFSSSRDGNNKMYVLDFPFAENTPIEITPNTSAESTPISWSPDGRYLLFDSVYENHKTLSIWDGSVVLDIYTYHEAVSEVVWSANGQLAFTDFYSFISPHEGDSSEIFMWDGNATVSISQNPSGVDRFPAWSKDGQLAFLSEQDGEYDIFVWDGISKVDGEPDINTIVNVAPDLTHYFSIPTWTNIDSLAFMGDSESDSHVQVYVWDGQTARDISKNPSSHNGGQAWRNDGYWSFATIFSEHQNLYIRDEKNRTILETNGQQPAWSQNGILIFCVPDSRNWKLSMWNGKDVVDVAYGDFIVAKWNNGKYVYCSNG